MSSRFCSMCGNLLRIERGPTGLSRFACRMCPFFSNVTRKISVRYYFKRKEYVGIPEPRTDEDLGPVTSERCPKCSHPRAYFVQMQTRSGDEPMTIFYRCCKRECSHTWREG